MKNHDKKQDCNTLLQFGTVVHVHTYNEFTDTSVQVLRNIRLHLLTLYIRLVWWTMLRCINQQRLLTLYSFGMCSGYYQQYRQKQSRIIHLARRTLCRIRDEEGIYMVTVYHAVYLLHTTQMLFVLYSPQTQYSLRPSPWCCSICLVISRNLY